MKETMLKGASRRIVVVKSRDSKVFEEAHFILREGSDGQTLPDLLTEANRIVEKSCFPAPRKRVGKRGAAFAAGVFSGAAIEAAGLLLYLLFR